jgi:predicted lipid-binding transport protein (Tim44 family)
MELANSMNQVFDPFNIIILAVAIIIFFRLRAVLGTRTGNEKPFDPFSSKQNDEASEQSAPDNVVPLPGRSKSQPKVLNPQLDDEEEEIRPVWHGYATKGSAVAKGMEALAQKDSDFSPGEFLGGAKMAYEMIVTAFAEGDKSSLKPLLSREVYDGFVGAIDDRKKSGHSLESKFVGINKADITRIELVGRDAQISIKFVSDLITATLDSEDRVIDSGNNRCLDI